MKLLLLAPANSIHTKRWIDYYNVKGYEYKLITFSNHFDNDLKSNVNVYRLPKLLPGKISYLLNVFKVKKIIRQFSPDIVHAHYTSSYGLLAALISYHPFFLSVWGSDVYVFPKKSFIHKLLVKYVLSKADVICSTSYDMARELKLYTHKEAKITPFGIDLDVFRPKKVANQTKINSNITIGITKNLYRCYGVYELISAIGLLINEFPNVKLKIFGKGPDRKRCEALVKELGLRNIVEFLGFRPNQEMPDHLANIDICVFPSYSESFGVSALEAEACGIPVIVSNVGGLPEVVRHKETGIIVKGNSPAVLAEAIKTLLVDDKLRKKYGENARKFVSEHYNWHKNRELMSVFYEEEVDLQDTSCSR